jgi:hypothetical protein
MTVTRSRSVSIVTDSIASLMISRECPSRQSAWGRSARRASIDVAIHAR